MFTKQTFEPVVTPFNVDFQPKILLWSLYTRVLFCHLCFLWIGIWNLRWEEQDMNAEIGMKKEILKTVSIQGLSALQLVFWKFRAE